MPDTCPCRPAVLRLACSVGGSSVPEKRKVRSHLIRSYKIRRFLQAATPSTSLNVPYFSLHRSRPIVIRIVETPTSPLSLASSRWPQVTEGYGSRTCLSADASAICQDGDRKMTSGCDSSHRYKMQTRAARRRGGGRARRGACRAGGGAGTRRRRRGRRRPGGSCPGSGAPASASASAAAAAAVTARPAWRAAAPVSPAGTAALASGAAGIPAGTAAPASGAAVRSRVPGASGSEVPGPVLPGFAGAAWVRSSWIADAQSDQVLDGGGVDVAGDHGDDHRVDRRPRGRRRLPARRRRPRC